MIFQPELTIWQAFFLVCASQYIYFALTMQNYSCDLHNGNGETKQPELDAEPFWQLRHFLGTMDEKAVVETNP